MQFKYININFQSKYFVCIMVVLVSLKNVDLKTKNGKEFNSKGFSQVLFFLCIVHVRFICKIII